MMNSMLASVPAQPVPPKLSASSIYVRGPKLTQEELHERSQAALEVVQREGLPNLVERCRNGSDAEKEQAALTLSFIATHDSNCAGMIVSAGGIQPLISMLGVEDGRGDADPSLDMKEQAVKTIRDLCIGEPGNQRPIAEKGAIPHLLIILEEPTHPHSIKEAAAEALALLAYESAGGPAQEILTQLGGVHKLLACYRGPDTTQPCKDAIARCLRFLAVYNVAKHQMQALGILKARDADPDTDTLMPGLDGL